MMKRILFFCFFALTTCLISGQPNPDSHKPKSIEVIQIEKYILFNNFDSASYLMPGLEPGEYTNCLGRIISGDAAYKDFERYISDVENTPGVGFKLISDFINKQVKPPKNRSEINLDYVEIVWDQISRLRDEVSVEEASMVQTSLEDYVNRFNPQEPDVKKAKILLSTHQIVMYIIQKEIEQGKKLCQNNFELAEELGDKKLMIVSLYYLCDFIIFEGKLNEYIKTCEKSLEIENTLDAKSSYYSGTLIQIIDALVYKGGEDKRIQDYLSELYNLPESRTQSFSLFAKYLGTLDLNSAFARQIFNQFEVEGILGFSEKVEKLGEGTLNPNDFYQLLRELANTLEIHGFLKEAIAVKDRTVVSIKNIYSRDLANSLANYKTSQAVKEKDHEIKRQNERKNFYIIIAVLISVLLIVSITALLRTRKQSKILAGKNLLINEALKEKELLVREVHHRVKNNFQIVSSLLELQSRGIEDETARALANEGQSRVKSMALIHQKLYQNEDGLIDFKEYLQLLVKELTHVYTLGIQVETSIYAENMRFDVDTAIPLGLIVNELITNAYKYAFKKGKTGKLNLEIKRNESGNYVLRVSDNGSGLPVDFEVKKAKSLGIRLVNRLTKQLQGEVSYKNEGGAVFEINFKDIHSRKRIN